jgi:uncharacterized protein
LNLEYLLAAIRAQYALSWDGIHGISHWERVCENGLRLAERTGAQVAVVECFAYLHDAKRLNDSRDPGHGSRGAELARALHCDEKLSAAEKLGGEQLGSVKEYGIVPQGAVLGLIDEQVELLAFACTHHTEGLTEADVTVQTCWDADRLDLGRVGIVPNPERLCTPAARDPAILDWAWARSQAGQVWTLGPHHHR